MIEISHALWSKHAIGIALHKLNFGDNLFRITIKRKDGSLLYPDTYIINKEDAIRKYGISIINKPDLLGIWVPLNSIEKAKQEVV